MRDNTYTTMHHTQIFFGIEEPFGGFGEGFGNDEDDIEEKDDTEAAIEDDEEEEDDQIPEIDDTYDDKSNW